MHIVKIVDAFCFCQLEAVVRKVQPSWQQLRIQVKYTKEKKGRERGGGVERGKRGKYMVFIFLIQIIKKSSMSRLRRRTEDERKQKGQYCGRPETAIKEVEGRR